MSTPLTNAISNLGKYFDLGTGKDGKDSTEIKRTTLSETFLSTQNTIASVDALSDAEQDFSVKFKVVPWSDNTKIPARMLCAPYGKSSNGADAKNTQGFCKPKGSNYTVKDDIILEADSDLESNSLCIIQNFDTASTISTNNTGLVSFLMNGVSSLEWTRSAPFLEINLITSKMSIPLSGKFLSRQEDNFTRDIVSNSKTTAFEMADSKSDLSHIGGMDLFTMPQTLVSADDHFSKNLPGDPFRPLLSIIDFKTSTSGFIGSGMPNGRSVAREKKGTLRLLVHNQSYLADLTPLVKPDHRGHTKIVISYGWSHPDGFNVGRSSDAQANNDVGVIIDSTKVTETYSILDSKISFNESGEANIDLDLSFSSINTGLVKSKVTSAGETTTGVEVRNQVAGMIDLFGLNASGKSKTDFLVSAFLSKLESDQALSAVASRSLKEYRKAVTKVIKESKTSGDGAITNEKRKNVNKAGIEQLESLFKQFFGKDNGAAFLHAAAQSNPSSSIEGLIRLLTSKPDPFLPSQVQANPQKSKAGLSDAAMKGFASRNPSKPAYISFGKIFSSFAGPALLGIGGYSEVQLVFHPFNASSGAAHTLNIAQFPIKYTDFVKWLKATVKETGHMSVNDFLGAVAAQFIHASNSNVYGIRNLKKLSDVDKNLHSIYGFSDETGVEFSSTSLAPEFTTPRIVLTSQSAPKRDTINVQPHHGASNKESKSDLILRVHISDMNFTNTQLFRDALNAAQTTGVFPKRPRQNTESDTSVNHQKYQAAALKILGDSKIVKVFEKTTDSDGNHIDPLKELTDKVIEGFQDGAPKEGEKTLSADDVKKAVETMVNEYHFLKDDQVNQSVGGVINTLKTLTREELPGSIMYGIEGTGINTATIQTTQDPRVITLSLLDDRTPAQKDDDEKSGRKLLTMSVLPVEVDMVVKGCPFINTGQEFFIDLNTDTNLDQFYRVMSVDHSLSSGKFETSVKFTASSSGPKYQSAKGDITKFIVSRVSALASD